MSSSAGAASSAMGNTSSDTGNSSSAAQPVGICTLAPSEQHRWTKLADVGPPARAAHGFAANANAMGPADAWVFDGAGADGAFLNDLWHWDGGCWTQVLPANPNAARPRPRRDLGFVMNPANHTLFLVGEQGPGAADGIHGFWSYSITTGLWTDLSSSFTGLGRFGGAVDFVTNLGAIVMHGGIDPSKANATDSSMFSNGMWTPLTPTVAPGARNHATFTRAPGPKVEALFGGDTGALPFHDAFILDSGDDTRLVEGPEFAGHARTHHAAAFDTFTGRHVFHGGFAGASGTPEGTTIIWDRAGSWEVPAHVSLSPRHDAKMVTSAFQDILMVGGFNANGSVNGELWRCSHNFNRPRLPPGLHDLPWQAASRALNLAPSKPPSRAVQAPLTRIPEVRAGTPCARLWPAPACPGFPGSVLGHSCHRTARRLLDAGWSWGRAPCPWQPFQEPLGR